MNILHLEKSNSVRTIVGKIAAQRGHSVVYSADNESAWKTMNEKNIDLILLSYEKCDSGSGCEEFLKSLGDSSCCNIPVLAFVDEINHDTRERLFNMGIADFISRIQVSEGDLSRYFDLFLRDDRLIELLRTLDIALLDESGETAGILKKIFTLKKIEKIDYIKDAVELLENEKKYAIYILNLDKSMFSDKEIITALREKNCRCIILAVTGIEREGDMDSIIYAGADDVIFRPFKSGVMLSRLKANARIFKKIECI